MTHTTSISFEFFPPQTEPGLQKLSHVAKSLLAYGPEYCSVTFGAGGTTQANTPKTVYALKQAINVDVAPHISCISTGKSDIKKMLEAYFAQGITRLVVLRGDRLSGAGCGESEFQYASDLVAFIRQEFGAGFTLEVAAYPEVHPEADNTLDDFKHFSTKVAAGADHAITQYFYNAESYYRFMDRCEKAGLTIPVTPGIMPILDFANIRRFSARCGAEIPRWLFKEMVSYRDDPESMRQCGIDMVTRLCDQLLINGAPGLHFYTLNKAEVTREILDNLVTMGHSIASSGYAVAT